MNIVRLVVQTVRGVRALKINIEDYGIVKSIVTTITGTLFSHIYLKAFPNLDGKMAFHVPSGAREVILPLEFSALEMVLPLKFRLVAATNKNGALHDFFQTKKLET